MTARPVCGYSMASCHIKQKFEIFTLQKSKHIPSEQNLIHGDREVSEWLFERPFALKKHFKYSVFKKVIEKEYVLKFSVHFVIYLDI